MTIKKFNYKKWVVENKHGKAPSYSHYGSLEERNICQSFTNFLATGLQMPVTQTDFCRRCSDTGNTNVGNEYCGCCDSNTKPSRLMREQITQAETYIGCGLCDDSSQTPGEYACAPGIEFQITPDMTNTNVNPNNNWDVGTLTPDEIVGGFESIGYEGTRLYRESMIDGVNYYDYGGIEYWCSSGSSVIDTGSADTEEEEVEPEPTQTYGNTGSTLDGDTCPENGMSIVLTNPGGSFNFNMYCVTVDGQTPQVGDIVIGNTGNQGEILQVAEPGSGEITGTGGNAIFNLQLVSSGTPEPEGMPEPEGQPIPQGLAAPSKIKPKPKPKPKGKELKEVKLNLIKYRIKNLLKKLK